VQMNEEPQLAPEPGAPQKKSWIAPAPLAPWWHTVVLLAGIALLSYSGAKQFQGESLEHVNRMQTYTMTVGAELAMLAWVYFGLRLRRIPFRSILGNVCDKSHSVAMDLGAAAVFWIGSLVLLGSINASWMIIDARIHHRSLMPGGKPDAAQQHVLHTLTALAPGNATEIVAWIAVCMMAGFTEEIVFRGYFQRQFTAWGRGAIWIGVVLSAVLFGGAHGYQGARYMVLLSIFGALFSVLMLVRGNIRAGIFAHAWQDMIAGLGIALLHSRHLI